MNHRIALSLAVVGVVGGLTFFAYGDAPAGRYTITNGTVYDTKTKLTWQQVAPVTIYSWRNAKDYCAGLSLAGTGWRLPTAKELQTIVDESRSYSPLVDTTAFAGTPSDWFWSSSPLAGYQTIAWCVSFLDGSASQTDTFDTYYVRCVR
jgi:hypothetical protein